MVQTIFIRSIKSNSHVRILIHKSKLVVNTVVGSGGVVGIGGYWCGVMVSAKI